MMTTKSRGRGRNGRSGHDVSRLKWALTAGSLMASLLGTRLLALNDGSGTAVSVPPTPPATIVAVEAQEVGGVTVGKQVQLSLPSIPTAVAPSVRPVARTRSSR